MYEKSLGHTNNSNIYNEVKHLEKVPSLFIIHHISMNISHINFEDNYYAYSLEMEGKLCLHIGVRSFTILGSRCKNPLLPMPHDLPMFTTIFTSLSTMGEGHGWEHFQYARFYHGYINVDNCLKNVVVKL
jgi:hypothetical protein